MMTNKPTDWWDTKLTDRASLEFFIENLGDANMPSRVAVRNWAMLHGVGSVLDVGCGPALDRWQTEPGVHWTGCDASALLVDYVSKQGPQIIQARADNLPFKPRSFDLVYSRHVWEHLADFKPALSEACRVADKAVAIVFFQPPGESNVLRVIDDAYYNDYSLASVKAAFSRAWPNCHIREQRLPRAQYLPSGEMIVYVTRGKE